MDDRTRRAQRAEHVERISKEARQSIEEQIADMEALRDMVAEFNATELASRFNKTLDDRLAEVNKDLQEADDIKRVKYLQGEGAGLAFWREMPTVMVETLSGAVEEARKQLAAKKEETDE